MREMLIVGFGNLYRRDDGVGRHVLNALLQRWGRPPLDPLDDGFEDLGHAVDVVCLHQLVPELVETLKDYRQVVFVDAHVPDDATPPLYEAPLAVEHRTPFVYHQTHPSTLLALAQSLYGSAPAATLISVQGHDFDFGEGLSAETAALAQMAVERIAALAEQV
ncbi:MAG: hydrogenase maturation protease [Anaerolineae bacterium]|nr:hydrogenase maturation protease [Anaerolineae bacterium]